MVGRLSTLGVSALLRMVAFHRRSLFLVFSNAVTLFVGKQASAVSSKEKFALKKRCPCSESFVHGLVSGRSWGLPGNPIVFHTVVTAKDAIIFNIFQLISLA